MRKDFGTYGHWDAVRITQEEAEHAARMVCAHTPSMEAALECLEMLGLLQDGEIKPPPLRS